MYKAKKDRQAMEAQDADEAKVTFYHDLVPKGANKDTILGSMKK